MGSSPRVRGTAKKDATNLIALGIIPACAGNSPQYRAGGGLDEDHPRVCGEQTLLDLYAVDDWGSSPRVRGTAVFVRLFNMFHGIIPACAGNSTSRVRPSSEIWDHPRVCGEQLIEVIAKMPGTGSSPRVRGTAN